MPAVIFDGWTCEAFENASRAAGYDKDMAIAVFPGGIADIVKHFSDWTDRRMIDALGDVNKDELRIRDRVAKGLVTRFEILAPYKEAARKAGAYWIMPFRGIQAGSAIWNTADRIWQWAGDDSTDYNYYTKRGLLSGVISSSTLFWFGDESEQHVDTKAFVDRRIENVVRIGRFIGKMKKAA